jgi:hypothetical protein
VVQVAGVAQNSFLQLRPRKIREDGIHCTVEENNEALYGHK